MAAKTITIDVEAYDLLSRRKRKGESFSKTLKRLLADAASTASGLLRDLPRAAVASDTLDRTEEAIRDRRLDWTGGGSRTGRSG